MTLVAICLVIPQRMRLSGTVMEIRPFEVQSIIRRNLYSASYSPEWQRLTTKTLRLKCNNKT